MRILAWLLVPVVLLAVFQWPARHEPGVLVAEEPEQTAVAGLAGWDVKGWHLRPLARYRIRARLLGRESYWVDGVAKLAPVDVGLGWGRLSDQAVIDRLSFSQGQRFLRWSWSGREGLPVPQAELESHAANVHVIPASGKVLDGVRWTRAGRVVRLEGYLVEAVREGYPAWRSSLSRTDTGSGACEIMYVERFESE